MTPEFNEGIDQLIDQIDTYLARSYQSERLQHQNKKSSSYMSREYKEIISAQLTVIHDNTARCEYIFDLLQSIKRGEGLYRNQVDYMRETHVDFIQEFMNKHGKNIPIYTPPSHRNSCSF